jgi:hypothetical protein
MLCEVLVWVRFDFWMCEFGKLVYRNLSWSQGCDSFKLKELDDSVEISCQTPLPLQMICFDVQKYMLKCSASDDSEL